MELETYDTKRNVLEHISDFFHYNTKKCKGLIKKLKPEKKIRH